MSNTEKTVLKHCYFQTVSVTSKNLGIMAKNFQGGTLIRKEKI